MRVVSGKYRGKKLVPPPEGAAVRPTVDRVKEALFDILQFTIAGSRVLDLFAGSGALGIEAVSRGAERVVFADADASLARRNLALIGETCPVLACDYRAALEKLAASGERFDIVFLDPPYRSGMGGDALRLIAERGLLEEGGVAVLEHAPGDAACDAFGLAPSDTRVYGKVALTFYRRQI